MLRTNQHNPSWKKDKPAVTFIPAHVPRLYSVPVWRHGVYGCISMSRCDPWGVALASSHRHQKSHFRGWSSPPPFQRPGSPLPQYHTRLNRPTQTETNWWPAWESLALTAALYRWMPEMRMNPHSSSYSGTMCGTGLRNCWYVHINNIIPHHGGTIALMHHKC